MKHTELRAAVLDALEKHDTGATLFDGRPAVFDEADFPAVAVYLTGAEYTGEELDSDTWQAELHIEVFLPAQVAGVAYSRVSTFSGDYLRVTDNKGKTHDVLTGSDDGRHSNTSLAWGAGVQFNPTESVAIDIAYEGSGSGDWRTDGFIVGVGYKF
ncbi:Ail/Lom family outer membrane beta-barrel protein [Escherichia coli]|nr:Ail/Lom family outer membrane beta-barrel protein [Escherichia coli]